MAANNLLVLHVALLASNIVELRSLRPITLMAASSPMKLGMMSLAMVCWKLFPGLHCFPYATSVLPPLGGIDYYQHHGFVAWLTDLVRLCP